ncbi:hypothetical protein VU00_10652 [Candidatus Electrothrix marina]|uniref:Uncharacterized protein n=1 Tax=Candidatus Electrothrix marina TaxID=1859130 RepID=A0A444JBP8_9BACT|nr:hypothetical protein VU00_10652 [Candidatus Electrothrix marina]
MNPLAQVATGDALNKLKGKDVFRPHAFDFFQEHRRGVQDFRQGTEFRQGIPCRLFAVGTGGAEGQEEFDDFGVCQGFNALFLEFIPEPLTMACAVAGRIFCCHGQGDCCVVLGSRNEGILARSPWLCKMKLRDECLFSPAELIEVKAGVFDRSGA